MRARAGAIGFPEAAADTPSAQLSGGKRRGCCWDWRPCRPASVILDEPTITSTSTARAALITAINELRAQ